MKLLVSLEGGNLIDVMDFVQSQLIKAPVFNSILA